MPTNSFAWILSCAAQSISNVVWALGRLRWHDSPLLEAAAAEAAARPGDFSVEGWTGLLWGCTRVGHDPLAFADATARRVRVLLSSA